MLTPIERIRMIAQAMEGMSESDWEVIKKTVDSEFKMAKWEVTLGTSDTLVEAIERKWRQANRDFRRIASTEAVNPRVKLCEEPTTNSEEKE